MCGYNDSNDINSCLSLAQLSPSLFEAFFTHNLHLQVFKSQHSHSHAVGTEKTAIEATKATANVFVTEKIKSGSLQPLFWLPQSLSHHCRHCPEDHRCHCPGDLCHHHAELHSYSEISCWSDRECWLPRKMPQRKLLVKLPKLVLLKKQLLSILNEH